MASDEPPPQEFRYRVRYLPLGEDSERTKKGRLRDRLLGQLRPHDRELMRVSLPRVYLEQEFFGERFSPVFEGNSKTGRASSYRDGEEEIMVFAGYNSHPKASRTEVRVGAGGIRKVDVFADSRDCLEKTLFYWALPEPRGLG